MDTTNSSKQWKRIGGGEYLHASGARVYRYNFRRAFQAQEWGVQLKHWPQGDGGFSSMAEAKRFVERTA